MKNTLKQNKKYSIMLIISSLEYGGAERQVIEIINKIDRNRFDPIICSLSHHTPLANQLVDKNNDLCIVQKKSRFDISVIPRVIKILKARQVDLVHAFLFDAEISARIAARIAGVPVVIASERNSNYKRPWIHTILQHLTKQWIDALIANSNAGRKFAISDLGLKNKNVYVIRNGIDTAYFRPEKESGEKIRKELNINSSDHVIGMVASFKRQKHHDCFLKIAEQLLKRFPNTWFLLVGEPLRDNQQNAHSYHLEIQRIVEDLGIGNRCLFLGSRSDMPAIYNACDLTVLTSSREGTPNVLLESMSCGTPVVASDIADNRYIIKNNKTGFVVPFGNVKCFTDKIATLLQDHDKKNLFSESARIWIKKSFSTDILVENIEYVYESLLKKVKYY